MLVAPSMSLETAPQVDTVILLSGDGDFAVLLDKVRETYGVATEVYSVEALTANVRTNAAALVEMRRKRVMGKLDPFDASAALSNIR